MSDVLGSILLLGSLPYLIVLVLVLVLIFSIWYVSIVLNKIKRLNEDILDVLESKEKHKVVSNSNNKV